MSADTAWYLDSSAIVKLVVEESESDALLGFIAQQGELVTSGLAITEVLRSVLALGESFRVRAWQVLSAIGLIRITDRVLEVAGLMEPAGLRSLDAIHLATAALLGSDLAGVVTYDNRMSDAAASRGFSVVAPS